LLKYIENFVKIKVGSGFRLSEKTNEVPEFGSVVPEEKRENWPVGLVGTHLLHDALQLLELFVAVVTVLISLTILLTH
jgi:hypothetical protein